MADVPVTYVLPVVSTQGTTNRVDFSKDLPMDYEDAFPFTVLTTKMQDEKANNIEFKYAIGRQAPRYSPTTAATAAGAVDATATIAVTNGEYFVAGDTIETPDTNNDATHTNQLYVVSVSSDTLTVQAYNKDTYGVAAVDSGAVVRRIAPAFSEKNTGATGQQTEPTVSTGYCQELINGFELTDTQSNIWQYTHPERTRLREESRLKHLQDLETASFLQIGTKDVDTATAPRYQMSGIISLVTSNVFHYGAEMDKNELYSYMQQIHAPAYAAGKARLVFASAGFLANINKLVDNKDQSSIRITPADKTWGPNITRMQFAGWTWDFVDTPVLTAARDGWAVVAVPRYLKKRTFFPTTYEMDIRTPGYSYFSDRFKTVCGFQLSGPEETMAVIRP